MPILVLLIWRQKSQPCTLSGFLQRRNLGFLLFDNVDVDHRSFALQFSVHFVEKTLKLDLNRLPLQLERRRDQPGLGSPLLVQQADLLWNLKSLELHGVPVIDQLILNKLDHGDVDAELPNGAVDEL